jgi:hypothetical protein
MYRTVVLSQYRFVEFCCLMRFDYDLAKEINSKKKEKNIY